MDRKASEYRLEAEMLRESAEAATDRITRETLMKLAQEYERMARNPAEIKPKILPTKPFIARYGALDFKP